MSDLMELIIYHGGNFIESEAKINGESEGARIVSDNDSDESESVDSESDKSANDESENGESKNGDSENELCETNKDSRPVGGKRNKSVQHQIKKKGKGYDDPPTVDSDCSAYYDSDDPPTVEENDVNNEEEEVESKKQKVRYPRYNPKGDPTALEVGLHFDDGIQFKQAMMSYVVHTKRNIYWEKNGPKYVRTECRGEGCPYFCSAGWDERSQGWQIKSINLEHRCNLKFKLKIVSQKWVHMKYEDKVAEDPCIGYNEMKRQIKAYLNLNVSLSKATRAVREIRKKLNLGFKTQFKRLRDYAQECLNSNPGSTMIINTNRTVPDGPCVFQRIYVCFGALKKGFLDGCRKVIAMDGCFLKGLLKGDILTAVGRDSNNQMYPIAWAVVETENNSSWRWFLELLKADLNIIDYTQWAIISDQQKGLANVIKDIFPGVEHRNCARHVHA